MMYPIAITTIVFSLEGGGEPKHYCFASGIPVGRFYGRNTAKPWKCHKSEAERTQRIKFGSISDSLDYPDSVFLEFPQNNNQFFAPRETGSLARRCTSHQLHCLCTYDE